MGITLSAGQCIYAFSKENKPVLTVKAGDTVEIETLDCFSNQVQESSQYNSLDWDKINPATGPIFIEEAMPGDILAVKIERIQINDIGVMSVGPGFGVLGDRIKEHEAKIIPIHEGIAQFNGIKIPLNKMIGVIGVAPKDEAISCGTPREHGGNMDTKLVAEGATVYFPVFVEGALFGLGDLHGAMGDGEIGISGIEVAGKVTVSFQVIKGPSIPSPMLENETIITTIASAKTLDEAMKLSVEQMADYLLPKMNMTLPELVMFLSAVGNTEISQVVDPLVTARFTVPKICINDYVKKLF
ncbi:MAG: acetamidase/formamidase family protein [Bacillaceae bacterium]